MNEHGISRRRSLLGAGGATASWLGRDWLLGAEAASSASGSARPELTTLSTTFIPGGTGAYRRLIEAPGFPIVLRQLGTEAKPGREARRVALASVVHLTDIHLIDAQSPARVEFLDRYGDSPTQSLPFQSAYRPQETLTAHVAEAMVRQVNAVGAGPITGRSFDCAVSTGDSIDNAQLNELRWQMAVLRQASSAHGGTDQLVVLFSHHNLATLDNPVPDPAKPLARRVSAAVFEALLHGFPNVVLWG